MKVLSRAWSPLIFLLERQAYRVLEGKKTPGKMPFCIVTLDRPRYLVDFTKCAGHSLPKT
jgi:hypothetical protein